MAETVKKGQRITGADRAKLAGELTKKYADGEAVEEPAPVSEGVVPEESGLEGGVAGPSNSGTQ